MSHKQKFWSRICFFAKFTQYCSDPISFNLCFEWHFVAICVNTEVELLLLFLQLSYHQRWSSFQRSWTQTSHRSGGNSTYLMKGQDGDHFYHNYRQQRDSGMIFSDLTGFVLCSKPNKQINFLKVEIETGQAHGWSPWRPVCGGGRCLCLSQEVLGNFSWFD